MRRITTGDELLSRGSSSLRDWVYPFSQAYKLLIALPYRSGPHRDQPVLQLGILRVNCVDCLDRTNAAQFAIAKRAFGHQLYALGLLATPHLPFSCDAVDVLTEVILTYIFASAADCDISCFPPVDVP